MVAPVIARGGAILALSFIVAVSVVDGVVANGLGSESLSHLPPVTTQSASVATTRLAAPASPADAPPVDWVRLSALPHAQNWSLYGDEATYDAADGYLIAFAPQDTGSAEAGATPSLAMYCYNSTWALEDNTWLNLSIPGPPPRCMALLGYDAAAGYVVLFGGVNPIAGDLNDTWTYRAGAWTEVHPTVSPPSQFYDTDSMMYDAQLGCMLLVGTLPTPGPYNSNVTWEYCAGQWTELLSYGPPLTQVVGAGPTLGYDGADGCAMMLTSPVGNLGGQANYTYELCPGGNWTIVTKVGLPDLEFASMCWDPALSAVVLYGGEVDVRGLEVNSNATWEYANGQWSALNISGPPGRLQEIVAFDPQTSALVMTSGYAWDYASGCGSWCNDTWVLAPPAMDIELSISVAPSKICALGEPTCPASTTGSRVSVQLGVVGANLSAQSGNGSIVTQVDYGPYNWIEAPNLTFVSFGSIVLAANPDPQEQCVDVIAGTSKCTDLPTAGSVGSRSTLTWNWATGSMGRSLRIGDVWSVEFNVAATGPPFARVPVDACVTVGCTAGGSAQWDGTFSDVQFGVPGNASLYTDSWPIGTVQVLNANYSYSSPSPVSPGVPPGTGAPLPAPVVAPTPAPVILPVASAPSILSSVIPSSTAAAAGILAAAGIRIVLRPRTLGQAMLARVTRDGIRRRAGPPIRGSD